MSRARVLVAQRIAAPPARTFRAFVDEIGAWWRPSPLFRLTARPDATLAFEGVPPDRLVAVDVDGERWEVGAVHGWDPPHRLAFGWRPAGLADDQSTEVVVTFAPVDDGRSTRVTVEHFGWDTIPSEHATRHDFPLHDFQQRLAEWWRDQLDRVAHHVRI